MRLRRASCCLVGQERRQARRRPRTHGLGSLPRQRAITAMKMMQAMQAAGNTVTAGVSSANTNNTRLEQELATHKTNFSAALDKTLKPLQARQEEMIKTRTQPKGEAGMEFKSAADLAQFTALVQQENAEYEKVCASFFGPKGALTTWLASYKENVAKNMIAAGESNDSAMLAQMA